MTKGSEVLYEHNKKYYPVTVVQIIPENGEGKYSKYFKSITYLHLIACSKRRKIEEALSDEG